MQRRVLHLQVGTHRIFDTLFPIHISVYGLVKADTKWNEMFFFSRLTDILCCTVTNSSKETASLLLLLASLDPYILSVLYILESANNRISREWDLGWFVAAVTYVCRKEGTK